MCNNANPLPSHARVSQNGLLRIPSDWTFNDGSTIPLAFVTAYHGLVEIAHLKEGESVLIHTASGGVELAAIQVCRHVGALVFATAGTNRKRAFLSSLGIPHVFNSRNTNYSDAILEATDGAGVDVVLNSLTSEGFKEATLRACGRNARFIEMSKLCIWTEQEVKAVRPDVTYEVIDLTTFSEKEWHSHMSNLKKLIERNVICPLPTTRFDVVQLKHAFHYLQAGSHVGKVVVVMPEAHREAAGQLTRKSLLFNDNSTYLITGGLGGIGLEIAKWMIDSGAKHMLLVGRSPPTTKIQTLVNQWNSGGAHVIPVQADVGDYTQMETLFRNIAEPMGTWKLPPLRGIMHAAGILSDGLIANQDWQKLSSTFKTKIDGTLNLHKLSSRGKLSLEHFVLFSSIAAMFGPPGQCNHAAGNYFMDALAHFRHSVGLPATTVNWGQWAETGVAVNVDLPGMKALPTKQCLAALEHLLKCQLTQTCVMNLSSVRLFKKHYCASGRFLDEVAHKSEDGVKSKNLSVNEVSFWDEFKLHQREGKGGRDFLKSELKTVLRQILQMDDLEQIEDDTSFQMLGVDSLKFIELKNYLQGIFQSRVTLSIGILRDFETVHLLSEKLMQEFNKLD